MKKGFILRLLTFTLSEHPFILQDLSSPLETPNLVGLSNY